MATGTDEPDCLMTWIGSADLEAAGLRPAPPRQRPGAHDTAEPQPGPILRAVRERQCRRVLLLSDWLEPDFLGGYADWLTTQGAREGLSIEIESFQASLSKEGGDKRPTDYGAIYDAVVAALRRQSVRWPRARRVYLVSPGTAAMHAVWLLVSRMTDYRGELIETSKHGPLRTVTPPFEIAVAFRPPPGDTRLEREYRAALAEDGGARLQALVKHSGLADERMRMLERFARSDLNLLLLGETGTGKTHLAQAIHRVSNRKDGLVSINCAAIPPDLLESELFGHERGAFSGATARKPGLLEAAGAGTALLDEVGELAAPHQAKLLTAIERRELRRVGATRPVAIGCRFLFGTNRDLQAEVAAGRFRGDLYHRIAQMTFTLPPLREHPDDIAPLAEGFLDALNRSLADPEDWPDFPKRLTPAALDALRVYPWPGNVRELEATVQRAAIVALGHIVDAQHIEAAIVRPPGREGIPPIEDLPLPPGRGLDTLLKEIECAYYRAAMARGRGNQEETARLLGIGRDAVKKRLKNQCTD